MSLNIVAWVLRLEETIQNKGNRQVTATEIRNRWIREFMLTFLAL